MNFFSQTPKVQEKKLVENEVKEVIFQQIQPKQKRDFLRKISVPPLPPNIENCEIIKISYQLRIKAKTIGWNKSPKLKFPVIIGTIPIFNENLLIESELGSKKKKIRVIDCIIGVKNWTFQ